MKTRNRSKRTQYIHQLSNPNSDNQMLHFKFSKQSCGILRDETKRQN